MSIFQKISNFFSSGTLNQFTDGQILVEAERRRGTTDALSYRLQYESLMRSAQNLQKWKNAVAAASDPDNPSKYQLWQLYDNIMLDNHLRAIIDSRIMHAQRSAFKLVDDKGIENKDISYLLERPWMEDLIRIVLMSRFQGCSLIELYELNANQELATITEIPQPYFNAKAGLITKEMDDANGWPYKEGIYANYYVQIGKDADLGLLERIAPIALAKKLALGSYQDYIEKFGVPPLFITTDREDDGRLNQLIEAAKNFKSNQWMVGRGNEKFEVGKMDHGGTVPFLTLMNYANEEMSKAVLGGSGLTDEKAFVGSAEIQFTMAKDRFESDKLFFKYIFNEEIKPRLLKLSPVYAPLANYYFDWDNTETLDLAGIIDTVQKLGNIYDIDPDYITEVTGIPILGFKETPSFPSTGGVGEAREGKASQPAGGEDPKK